MNEQIGLVIISIGVLYDLFACIGLVRMPDVYTRLQTATKAVTIGTCFILIGVTVYFGFNATGAKAMLCMVFVLITNPTAAHAIARGAHSSGIRVERITAQGLLGRRVESELWDRIRESDEFEKDRFDCMLESCPVLDIDGHMGCEELFARIAPQLAEVLNAEAKDVEEKLIEREREAVTALEPHFAIPHIMVDGENAFGMLAIRAHNGIWFSKECPNVNCIFILGGTSDQWHFHLRSLAAIAQMVQMEGFYEDWTRAENENRVRELLLYASSRRRI